MAELQDLTCIGDMIQDPVMVFNLSPTQKPTILKTAKLDPLDASKDFIDTWGPEQFFVDSKVNTDDNISAMSFGGGTIQLVRDHKDVVHWRDRDWVDGDGKRFNSMSKNFIGAAIKVNEHCRADEAERWASSEDFLDHIRTSEPYWKSKETERILRRTLF